jgi:hypothetical protein
MYTSENSKARDSKLLQPRPELAANGRSPFTTTLSNDPTKFEPPPLNHAAQFLSFDSSAMPPPPSATNINAATASDPVLVSDADLLLNLHSPYAASSPNSSRHPLQPASFARSSMSGPTNNNLSPQQQHASQMAFSPNFATFPTPTDQTFGDMVIDSQEVDMSVLGADMMPWDLEYLPHDMLYFGDSGFGLGLPDDTVEAPER